MSHRVETISEYLADEHRRCDRLFADAEQAVAQNDWAAAEGLVTAFQAALERHLQREEQVLFPRFEAATGHSAGPTQVMRGEHMQMRELLGNLAQAMSAGDRDDCLGIFETLLIMMQQHNLKEEQVLYPMSDEALGPDVAGTIEEMKGRGAPPGRG